MQDFVEEDIEDDEPNHLARLQEEARDAMTEVLNSAKVQILENQGGPKIQPTVEVDGHCIFKSTLVSQLNGNNFLSKDRLARIKHNIQFNNHDNCVRVGMSLGTGFLSIGSNCAVHFV